MRHVDVSIKLVTVKQLEFRRAGRVAEGAPLLRVYTGNRIEGSNPSLSAIFLQMGISPFVRRLRKMGYLTIPLVRKNRLERFFTTAGSPKGEGMDSPSNPSLYNDESLRLSPISGDLSHSFEMTARLSFDATGTNTDNCAPTQSDYAPVAQLDRVLGYEPSGREFESLQARHT